CLETARLATGKEPEPFPPLNNFFDDRSRAPAQIAELKAFLARVGMNERLLSVTHGVVVSALTGQSVAEGEILILKLDGAGNFAVAGRIPPP
ncbi:MAG: histidine phosphatase family protein, partial [Hyphomicrobiaceae bacterium]